MNKSVAPATVKAAITVEMVKEMSSLQLYTAIGVNYPDYVEGECVSYLTGAAKAALMLGLSEDDVNGFMSEWARYDEKLYVATLFVAAKKKSADFALMLGAGSADRAIVH